MAVSFDRRLQHLLDTIYNLARTTDIVSINASISAARMSTAEGRAFKEISNQIRGISKTSLKNLEDLQEVFEQVRLLTGIINLAGKQRMLAQKAMKLHLLAVLHQDRNEGFVSERKLVMDEFETSLQKLIDSKINTPQITSALQELKEDWTNFGKSLSSTNVSKSNELINQVVTDMDEIVGKYQRLAG